MTTITDLKQTLITERNKLDNDIRAMTSELKELKEKRAEVVTTLYKLNR